MYEFIYYRAADVMTKSPLTIQPDTSLAAVESLFEQHDFNGLPVLDAEQRLVGMVTKLDFLKAFVFTADSMTPRYEEIMRRRADSVMSPDPRTVEADTPLTRILEDMVKTRFKSFPVLANGRLIGIVAREDVARALRRAAAGERPARTAGDS